MGLSGGEINRCDPTRACCFGPEVQASIQKEATTPPPATSDTFPAITQYTEVVANNTLRGFSRATLTHVVQTGNSFQQLANQCQTGAREKLGRGAITDLATLGCMAGGMIEGMVAGILSFPTRLHNMADAFVHGAGETQGAAVADAMFLGMEAAGYGQMASGFMGRAPLPSVNEVPPSIGNISLGGGNTAVAFPTGSLAFAVPTGAVGNVIAAAAATSNADFGAPMATPRPVKMDQAIREEKPTASPKPSKWKQKEARKKALKIERERVGGLSEKKLRAEAERHIKELNQEAKEVGRPFNKNYREQMDLEAERLSHRDIDLDNRRPPNLPPSFRALYERLWELAREELAEYQSLPLARLPQLGVYE